MQDIDEFDHNGGGPEGAGGGGGGTSLLLPPLLDLLDFAGGRDPKRENPDFAGFFLPKSSSVQHLMQWYSQSLLT
jgi:hypothetical protein